MGYNNQQTSSHMQSEDMIVNFAPGQTPINFSSTNEKSNSLLNKSQSELVLNPISIVSKQQE